MQSDAATTTTTTPRDAIVDVKEQEWVLQDIDVQFLLLWMMWTYIFCYCRADDCYPLPPPPPRNYLAGEVNCRVRKRMNHFLAHIR